MRLPLRRRVLLAPLTLALLVSLLPARGFASPPPGAELTAPGPGETVQVGVPVQLVGLVRDAVVSGGWVQAFVSVQGPDGRWLQNNGSWSLSWATRGARVGAPVGADADVRSWTFDMPALRAGMHKVNIQVQEPGGRKREYVRTSIDVIDAASTSPTPSESASSTPSPSPSPSVTSEPPPSPSDTDDVRPGTSGAAPTRIIAPVKQASYAAAETITVTGRSQDRSAGPPPGIAHVRIQVTDVDRGGYVDGDGRLTGLPVTFEADAANEVDGTLATATWSLPLPADLPPGLYEVTAKAVDLAGNWEPILQRRRFTVGHGSGDAFVTILLGRSIFGYSMNNEVCPAPVTGVNGRILTLDEVAERLAARPRPVPLTGTVYLEFIHEEERSCGTSDRSYPSWADLARYRDDYGWTFVSGGYDYNNLVTAKFPLTTRVGEVATLEENICGSLAVFAERGFVGAAGLFPYPNNKHTDSMQGDVTSRCFAFGRQYNEDPTVRGVPVFSRSGRGTQLWFQRTMSVTGGNCGGSGLDLPCRTTSDLKQYDPPQRLRDLVDVEAGTWATVQFYTFAEGSRTEGDGPRWNCEGPESEHWTSVVEMYCWDDFVTVLDAIPHDARVVDPATVADAWGRSPG